MEQQRMARYSPVSIVGAALPISRGWRDSAPGGGAGGGIALVTASAAGLSSVALFIMARLSWAGSARGIRHAVSSKAARPDTPHHAREMPRRSGGPDGRSAARRERDGNIRGPDGDSCARLSASIAGAGAGCNAPRGGCANRLRTCAP
jgi:hypothetical protein